MAISAEKRAEMAALLGEQPEVESTPVDVEPTTGIAADRRAEMAADLEERGPFRKFMEGPVSEFMTGFAPGLAKSVPGGTMLSETEPRVLAEEKEFVPLLGRIPGIGKLLELAHITQTTPTKRQALVYAPPGTEAQAREMYPEANLFAPQADARELAILKQLKDMETEAEGTTLGNIGAVGGEFLGRAAQAAPLVSAVPLLPTNGLQYLAEGAAAGIPWAMGKLEEGKYGEALGTEAAGALTGFATGKLGDMISSAAYKPLAAAMKRVNEGTGSNVDHWITSQVGQLSGLVNKGVLSADDAIKLLRQMSAQTASKGGSLAKSLGAALTGDMGVKGRVGTGLTGAVLGTLLAPEGHKLKGAAIGGIRGATGKSPASGVAEGALWNLMLNMFAGGGPQATTPGTP